MSRETEATADLEENIYTRSVSSLSVYILIYCILEHFCFLYLYIHATYKKYSVDTFHRLLLLITTLQYLSGCTEHDSVRPAELGSSLRSSQLERGNIVQLLPFSKFLRFSSSCAVL